MTELAQSAMTLSAGTDLPRSSGGAGIANKFSLKPFGEDLLSSGADFWIFSARLVILIMAAAEALAWGYVGWLVSSRLPWLTASVAATFIFVLIWVIDTSFMTLDLGRAGTGGKERARLAAGIVGRIAIVTVSLLITAPFLAQAIFSGDIQAELVNRNAATIAEARGALEASLDGAIGEIRADQRSLEQQRVDESAGAGPSGRYGRGPVVETIERQLADKRAELATALDEKRIALERFDQSSSAELQERYGLSILSRGVGTSGAILESLRGDPRFARAEIAVKVFLAILFAGLLILKLFQPRSVAIYFDEKLQSLYSRWKRGMFDAHLPAGERAADSDRIDPLRFEEWYRTSYSVIEQEELERRTEGIELSRHHRHLDRWKSLGEETSREADSLRKRRQALELESRELEKNQNKLRSELELLRSEQDAVRHRGDALRGRISAGSIAGEGLERALEAVENLERRYGELEARIVDGSSRLDEITSRKASLKEELGELLRESESRDLIRREFDELIDAERSRFARSFS